MIRLDVSAFWSMKRACSSSRVSRLIQRDQRGLAGLLSVASNSIIGFPTKSQDVCRIEEGSTNAYLMKDRAVEEFLEDVEPRYNA